MKLKTIFNCHIVWRRTRCSWQHFCFSVPVWSANGFVTNFAKNSNRDSNRTESVHPGESENKNNTRAHLHVRSRTQWINFWQAIQAQQYSMLSFVFLTSFDMLIKMHIKYLSSVYFLLVHFAGLTCNVHHRYVSIEFVRPSLFVFSFRSTLRRSTGNFIFQTYTKKPPQTKRQPQQQPCQ